MAGYLAARVAEAVGEVFQIHWPHRQPNAGRGLRRSALHDALAAAGAVFGAATRVKDLAWIERQRRRLGLVAEVSDSTSSEIVIGITGLR